MLLAQALTGQKFVGQKRFVQHIFIPKSLTPFSQRGAIITIIFVSFICIDPLKA